MAQFQQINPSFRKRDDDESGIYDDENPSPKSDKLDHARQVSAGADDSLSDIDRVLADDESGTKNPRDSSDGATASPKALKDAESSAADGSSSETNGKGFYRPGGSKQSRGKKTLIAALGTKTKRRMAAGGIILAGGIVGSMLMFLSLVPLKIVSFVNNITSTFSATADNATGKEATNMFDHYITNKVFPQLTGKGKCTSTISPGCVFQDSTGNNPVQKLYHAWHDDKLEQKLATNYDLVFGRDAHGKYYISTNGQTINLKNGPDGRPTSIFNFADADKKGLSRSEVRAIIKDRLSNETLFKRVLFRYTYGKFLERKYGVKRCTVACTPSDLAADKKLSLKMKKQAAKAYIVRKVLTPLNENYSILIQCIMEGGTGVGGECDTKLNPTDSSDADHEAKSGLSKGLQEQLDKYAATLGSDTLSKLLADLGDKSLTQFFVEQATKKIASTLLGEASTKVTGIVATAGELVDPITWVIFLAQLQSAGAKLGPMLQYMSYATNAAASVQMFEMYNSAASEMQSGNTDSALYGSLADSLTTNADSTSTDQSDMTDTNLYKSMYGNLSSSGNTSLASALLPGTALAASASSKSPYLCNDGNPQPANEIICPEEKLAQGNTIASAMSGLFNSPLFKFQTFNDGLVTKVITWLQQPLGWSFNLLCTGFPGCQAAMSEVGKYGMEFMTWLLDKVIASPFSTQSGGRNGDMTIAGGDVYFNKACQDKLGCNQLSDVAVQTIRNSQQDELKAAFNSESMFARIFDRTSPYSLVSKMAVAMPANLQSAVFSGFNGLLENPFGRMGNMLLSVFSYNRAFAAAPAAPDPFGVVQYGYNDADIPSDPEAYWDAHCGGSDPTAFNNIVTAWANAQTQDPNTGDALATTPQPCLLIQATVGAAGGMYDTSLLGSDFSSDPGFANGVGTGSTGTGTVDCSSAVGNAKLPCAAQQAFGYPYAYFGSRGANCVGGGGQNGGPDIGYPGSGWLALVKSSPDGKTWHGKNICIGCSGFVNVSLYLAYGIDLSETSSGFWTDKNFKQIPMSSIQPGDLLIENPTGPSGRDNHVVIVKSYDSASGKLTTVESSAGNNIDGQPLSGIYSYNSLGFFGGAVRYTGPGSG